MFIQKDKKYRKQQIVANASQCCLEKARFVANSTLKSRLHPNPKQTAQSGDE
jgi:hypothetical protein